MRYALIGCGRVSRHHIAAAIKNNLEIIALCDLESYKAEQHIVNYEINANGHTVKAYTDYKKMIREQKLDLVAIATESGSHAQIACECLKQKINLIIEKPLALDYIEAQSIIDTAKKYNCTVSVCHQNRFNKAVQNLRTAIDQNRFGKILYGSLHVRWFRSDEYYAQSPWRGTWNQDGGALMNQCIHGIDLLLWMMGSPVEEIYGTTRRFLHKNIQAEDFGMAIVQFKNGTVATIEGTTDVFKESQESCLCIFGTNGTVKIGGPALNSIETWTFKDKNFNDEKMVTDEKIKNVYGNCHPLVYQDVIQAVLLGKSPYITAQDGKSALEVILAIYKSAKEKKPVNLPLKNFSIKDMNNFRWEC